MNEVLFVEDNKCPICESELLSKMSTAFSDYGSSVYCKNGCFKTYKQVSYIDYTIFNHLPITIFEKAKRGFNQIYVNDVLKLIEYYKKDYRYIAEMLTKD